MKTSVKILAFVISFFLYTGINSQTTNPYPGTNPSTNPSLNDDTTDMMKRTPPTRRDKTRMDDTTYQKKGDMYDTTMTLPGQKKGKKPKMDNDTLQ